MKLSKQQKNIDTLHKEGIHNFCPLTWECRTPLESIVPEQQTPKRCSECAHVEPIGEHGPGCSKFVEPKPTVANSSDLAQKPQGAKSNTCVDGTPFNVSSRWCNTHHQAIVHCRDEKNRAIIAAIGRIHAPILFSNGTRGIQRLCITCCFDAKEQRIDCVEHHDHRPNTPICVTVAILEGIHA